MCVRHIPFLASLQSRRDLQAWVSVTTFYCLQACEQGLLFGRGLNSKRNKLGFFIWQRFFNCNGFLQFPWPQSGGRGRGGGEGLEEQKWQQREEEEGESRRMRMKKAVWWCIFKGNECESTQWPLRWLRQVVRVCVREGEPDPRERASAFPTLMALWKLPYICFSARQM